MTEEEVDNKQKGYSVLLLGIVSAILAMPLFILLYKYFPSIEIPLGENSLRLDHIVLFLSIFFLTYYLVKKFRALVYIIMVGGIVLLTITNFSGIYTLENLHHDYSQFLYDLSGNSLRQKFESHQTIFKNEKELREAIDYKNPKVRNYAASIAVKHFDDKAYLSTNRKWVQFFSIFKEVYGNWRYVFDPLDEEYYSSGSNTLNQLQFDGLFKGDCDDYSIMIASCIKAVGGEVRLVRTVIEQDNMRIGHMYPEVKFGDSKDLETVVYLIKNIFFVEESFGKSIFYFEDSKGYVWLNFDYNAPYPGGKYMSEIRQSEITI